MDKKVLIYSNVIPPDYGGSYLRIYRLADRLDKNGLLYKIVTYTSKSVYENFEHKTISSDKVIFLKYKVELLFKILFLFLTKAKSFNSVYIVSIQWHSFLIVLLAKIFGKKVLMGVTLSMIDSPATRSNSFLKNLYYKTKNLQFLLSDKVVVNSPLLYKECLGTGICPDKVEMIPNPVDQTTFYKLSVDSKKALRRKLYMKEKEINLLFVGVLVHRKGLDTLMKICNELSKLNLKFCMNIIGNEKSSESDIIFVKQIKDSILNFNKTTNSCIKLLGVKNNVNEYMQASDFFVFPSRNEGLPNVVIEAMSSGLPIVSSNLEGITDYLLDPEFLIKPNNYKGFSKVVFDTLKNPNKMNKNINRNLDFVKERLVTNKNLDKFRSLIE